MHRLGRLGRRRCKGRRLVQFRRLVLLLLLLLQGDIGNVNLGGHDDDDDDDDNLSDGGQ
jgi:hypothetical protein